MLQKRKLKRGRRSPSFFFWLFSGFRKSPFGFVPVNMFCRRIHRRRRTKCDDSARYDALM